MLYLGLRMTKLNRLSMWQLQQVKSVKMDQWWNCLHASLLRIFDKRIIRDSWDQDQSFIGFVSLISTRCALPIVPDIRSKKTSCEWPSPKVHFSNNDIKHFLRCLWGFIFGRSDASTPKNSSCASRSDEIPSSIFPEMKWQEKEYDIETTW